MQNRFFDKNFLFRQSHKMQKTAETGRFFLPVFQESGETPTVLILYGLY